MSQGMLGRTYRGGVLSLRRWGSCSEQGVCPTYRPTEAPTAPIWVGGTPPPTQPLPARVSAPPLRRGVGSTQPRVWQFELAGSYARAGFGEQDVREEQPGVTPVAGRARTQVRTGA